MRYLVLALCVCVIGSAHGQTTVLRDKNGIKVGSITQEGQRSIERDKDGIKTGSFAEENGHVVFRDKDGIKTGSAQTTRH